MKLSLTLFTSCLMVQGLSALAIDPDLDLAHALAARAVMGADDDDDSGPDFAPGLTSNDSAPDDGEMMFGIMWHVVGDEGYNGTIPGAMSGTFDVENLPRGPDGELDKRQALAAIRVGIWFTWRVFRAGQYVVRSMRAAFRVVRSRRFFDVDFQGPDTVARLQEVRWYGNDRVSAVFQIFGPRGSATAGSSGVADVNINLASGHWTFVPRSQHFQSGALGIPGRSGPWVVGRILE